MRLVHVQRYSRVQRCSSEQFVRPTIRVSLFHFALYSTEEVLDNSLKHSFSIGSIVQRIFTNFQRPCAMHEIVATFCILCSNCRNAAQEINISNVPFSENFQFD